VAAPVPGDRRPFRKEEMTEEQMAQAYQNRHDLREMYTRENTERRRIGSHTLRRYLTQAQDKLLTAQMVKIRDEYETANNDDVVLVFVQQQVAAGKGGEFDAKLLDLAQKARIPKRTQPFR
jgi:polyphosphate kinase 2 (PPK2 family)